MATGIIRFGRNRDNRLATLIYLRLLTVFGRRFDGAEVIGHDLPFSGPIDGLLGMDLLVALHAQIDIPAAQISVR